MTTKECIEKTYNSDELSDMLSVIVDELSISPPCDTTKEFFKIRITSLIRHNRIKAETLANYQSALTKVLQS